MQKIGDDLRLYWGRDILLASQNPDYLRFVDSVKAGITGYVVAQIRARA